ncbi:MAG: hypothetical protein AMJ93_15600 [Anaerolineae bacterium SM23_84]|nr:MAG: hypothetical protein AMJ93_15600 [Anaerolineae bacterium SM23_84]
MEFFQEHRCAVNDLPVGGITFRAHIVFGVHVLGWHELLPPVETGDAGTDTSAVQCGKQMIYCYGRDPFIVAVKQGCIIGLGAGSTNERCPCGLSGGRGL